MSTTVHADNNVLEQEIEEDSDVFSSDDDISFSLHQQFYNAKDGTLWINIPNSTSKFSDYNILRQRSGPVKSTKIISMSDLFKRFFDATIYDIAIRQTN